MTDAPDADHSAHERLIARVLHSLGPAADGGQLATNISFAQRLVAALLELRLVHARAAAEQDQPKKEDGETEQRPPTPRELHDRAAKRQRQDPVT